MAETTNIEWADSTLNIWEGCQKTGSPACEGCYAEARNLRYAPKGTTEAPNWGPRAPRREVKSWRSTLRKISRLALAAFAAGRTEPWLVFVNSLSDFFDNQVDPKLRAEAMAAFREHPHLTFLLLTKRPQNIVSQFAEVMRITAEEHGPLDACWPRNVAIGCTVVTQKEANRDLRHLLEAKDVLRPAFAFVSMEPLVERVDLTRVKIEHWDFNVLTGLPMVTESLGIPISNIAAVPPRYRLDWVIVGGGTDQGRWKAPPMNPQWVRDIRDACERAGAPFMLKQSGEYASVSEVEGTGREEIHTFPDHRSVRRVGKKRAGRTLDGKTYDGRPRVIVENAEEGTVSIF